jgi:hypothetical protein
VLRDAFAIPRDEPPRRYDAPHILWYFGALTAAAWANATVFSVSEGARGTYQLLLSLFLLAAFGAAALFLLEAGRRVPGGVLVVTTVALVPAVTQAFERLIGVWPSADDVVSLFTGDFQGSLLAVGVVTITAGLIAFRLIRFPFVFLAVTVAVVYTGQVLVPAFVDEASPSNQAKGFIVTAAALLLVGFVLDTVGRNRDAFWWHTIGLLALLIGLGWYASTGDDDWAWVALLLIGAALVLASAPFGRATWATYGVLFVYGAALHYVTDWTGSWKEPALMVLVSMGLLLLGIVIQLQAHVWAARLKRPPREALPPLAAQPPAELPPEPEPPSEEPPAEEAPPEEPPPPGQPEER